jgi:replicative DNA helicase
MDVEQEFLSCVILDERTKDAVNARVTLDFFADPKWQRVYQYILDHWRKYSQAADEHVVHGNFPSYAWTPTSYSFDYLVDALRDRRAKAIALDALNEAAALVSSSDSADVWKMLDIMGAAVMQARIETAPALDMPHEAMVMDLDDILHERMLEPGYLRGISTGFKGIDFVTGGLQPEQFVVLIGLPKSLKSSLLLQMALHVQEQHHTGLFVGFEMSNGEQRDRAASLLSGVGLTDILNGTITERQRKHIMRSVRARDLMPTLVYSEDNTNNMTVSGLQGKLMEYNPDVLFVDSAYLMLSEIPKVEQGGAAALTDVARSLKKLAQAQHIPIVATTQASQTRSRGGKLTAESPMYSQGWRQSADVLVGAERVDQEQPEDGEVTIALKVLATRSGPRAETHVVWDWSKGRCLEIDPKTGLAYGATP